LCQLWKRIDRTNNLSAQLDAIIAEADNLELWREAFVRTPAAISFCDQRFVRRNSAHEVYLLQKKQMNGTHAELFTYCLYINTLTPLEDGGLLGPLKLLPYQSQIGADIEPGISLQFHYENSNLRFEIEFKGRKFIIYIPCDKVTRYPLIETTLIATLGFEKENSLYIKEVAPDLIESTVLELIEKLGATPRPEQNNK
jgi:hypothetical protein